MLRKICIKNLLSLGFCQEKGVYRYFGRNVQSKGIHKKAILVKNRDLPNSENLNKIENKKSEKNPKKEANEDNYIDEQTFLNDVQDDQQRSYKKMSFLEQERFGIEKIIEDSLNEGLDDNQIIEKTLQFKKEFKELFYKSNNLEIESIDSNHQQKNEFNQDIGIDIIDDWQFQKENIEIRKIANSMPYEMRQSLMLETPSTKNLKAHQNQSTISKIKSNIGEELIAQGAINTNMTEQLTHMSITDIDELMLASDKQNMQIPQDPTNSKETPVLYDQDRKEIEATVWDDDQDRLIKEILASDRGDQDSEWWPTEEEMRETPIQALVADEKKRAMTIFKSDASEEGDTLKDKAIIEADRIADKFGITKELSRDLMKQFIFEQKVLEEENAKIAEHRKKKLEKKAIMDRLDNIKSVETGSFEDEIPYHEISDGINPSHERALKKKIKDKYMGYVSLIKPPKNIQMHTDKYIPESNEKFQIYYKRMTNRIEDWQQDYFFNSHNQNLGSICDGYEQVIDNIMINNGMSVINVFWTFSTHNGINGFKYWQAKRSQKELIERLNEKQNNFGKHKLSHKIMKQFGMKRMLELRFHFSTTIDNEIQFDYDSDTNDYTQQLLMKETNQAQDVLKIDKDTASLDYKAQTMSLKKAELEEESGSNFGNYEDLRIRIKAEKKNRLVDDDGKRIRNNRTEDGKRKKYRKRSLEVDIWEQIGLAHNK